jgi:hypothetical protein
VRQQTRGAVGVVPVVSSPPTAPADWFEIGESHVVGTVGEIIRRTCHTVCSRPVESTPTALSIRSGSFR